MPRPKITGHHRGSKRNGRISGENAASLRMRRGGWRYDYNTRQRVEDIFHLYDSDGSGQLELNEYYMLDHVLHRFDTKGLARLARKCSNLAHEMCWDPDEDEERVRSQFQTLWDKDGSTTVSLEEFHHVMNELLKQVHKKKRGDCGWSGVDRLLVQLEAGPQERGISELRMAAETMEAESEVNVMQKGVENVTIQQVLTELDRMDAELAQQVELAEQTSAEQLQLALVQASTNQQTCLFLQMCLRDATLEQMSVLRQRIHALEYSLKGHSRQVYERLKALQQK